VIVQPATRIQLGKPNKMSLLTELDAFFGAVAIKI